MWRGECVVMVGGILPRHTNGDSTRPEIDPQGDPEAVLRGELSLPGEEAKGLPPVRQPSSVLLPSPKTSSKMLPRIPSILKKTAQLSRNLSPGSRGKKYRSGTVKKVRIEAETPRKLHYRRRSRRPHDSTIDRPNEQDHDNDRSPKSQSPLKPAPEPKGIGRMRKFTFQVKWEARRLEGMAMTQHNPVFASEKRIQGSMLQDELKVLIDKIFQVRFILQRGLKVLFEEKV